MSSSNNLKQIMLTLHNYHSEFGSFPPAVTYSKDGRNRPLYSWRVVILPYLEELTLYQDFHLDEPWDSPNNIKLLERMPITYTPSQPESRREGPNERDTHYQAVVGSGAAFEPGAQKGLKMLQFTDGTSNTIMLVEAKKPVPWSAPQDVVFDPKGDLTDQLGGLFEDGFHVALVDGSVHFLKRKIRPPTLRAAITRAGGEVLPPDWLSDQEK